MEDNAIQVSRSYKIDGDSKLKAFVDIYLAGLVIKGLRIVKGSKGLFLGMPRQKAKDGKWYNTVYPANKEILQELNDIVMQAYQE